jgi:hypothetical protein
MSFKAIVDLSDVLNIPESFLFYDQIEIFRIESERSVKDSLTHLATEFEIVGYELENIFMRMGKYKIDTKEYSELKELYNKRYRKLKQIKYSLDKAMKIQLNHFKKKSKRF